MSTLLTKLDSHFRLGASAPGCPPEAVGRLRSFATKHGAEPPDDYCELIQKASDIELIVSDTGCVRIWSADRTIEINEACNIQDSLPGALAIGDDEGGNALLIMEGPKGAGLYRAAFAELDNQEAVFIAPSLNELLTHGVGVDRLFAWVE